MAKEIKGSSDDVSIYQIMWSLYLGNKDAFINENINLVRKDVDILVPKMTDIKNISYQIAKDSIITMNESFSNSFSSAAKSLLVLTAPETPETKEDTNSFELKEEETTFITFDDPANPADLVEQNTKQISLDVENEALDKLIEGKDESIANEDTTFEIFDLLFIALISLASGILLAFIFIYLRNMKNSKSIQYDFEEVYDDGLDSSSMPSGLSIENNANQQQLDLAITYFEMNDLDNAKKLLKDLLKSDDAEIQKASKKLLDKFN
jgi:FimV-like protein